MSMLVQTALHRRTFVGLVYFRVIVTDAFAVFVGSAADVALTVTSDGLGTDPGAR